MPKASQPIQLPADYKRTALLVVDVQQGLFQKSTPIYQSEQLLQNINALIERARQCDVPVIYIQHCDSRSLVKDSLEWQLHPGLHPLESDAFVCKEHSNAFEETNLTQILDEKKVGRLVVTGLVTHGCVKNTCLGGRELGYPVLLVADAHSSFSQDAAALIEKWHTNLSKAGVTLLPTAQVHFD